MTLDQAIALSLLDDLSRLGLTERLLADDPELLERATGVLPRARSIRDSAAAGGIRAVPWNAPDFPPALLSSRCPPASGAAARSRVWPRRRWRSSVPAPRPPWRSRRHGDRQRAGRARRHREQRLARGVDSRRTAARYRRCATARHPPDPSEPSWGARCCSGSVLDRIYPAEHRPLAQEISRRGARDQRISAATPPLPFHFPMRNRRSAGCRVRLSSSKPRGLGSLITAACALEQEESRSSR